jgi:hypothetical protein
MRYSEISTLAVSFSLSYLSNKAVPSGTCALDFHLTGSRQDIEHTPFNDPAKGVSTRVELGHQVMIFGDSLLHFSFDLT